MVGTKHHKEPPARPREMHRRSITVKLSMNQMEKVTTKRKGSKHRKHIFARGTRSTHRSEIEPTSIRAKPPTSEMVSMQIVSLSGMFRDFKMIVMLVVITKQAPLVRKNGHIRQWKSGRRIKASPTSSVEGSGSGEPCSLRNIVSTAGWFTVAGSTIKCIRGRIPTIGILSSSNVELVSESSSPTKPSKFETWEGFSRIYSKTGLDIRKLVQ